MRGSLPQPAVDGEIDRKSMTVRCRTSTTGSGQRAAGRTDVGKTTDLVQEDYVADRLDVFSSGPRSCC